MEPDLKRYKELYEASLLREAQKEEELKASKVREAQKDEALVQTKEELAQKDEALVQTKEELAQKDEAIEAGLVREAKSEAEKYLSNDSVLMAPTSLGSKVSVSKTTPAPGQPGPVGKLYLKDSGAMSMLEKDAKLPFNLVDVPVNTVGCGHLIQPIKFANESEVQTKFKEVLNTLFAIATESLLADCQVKLSSELCEEMTFGGHGGRVDVFAYLLFESKALPCLICEVKFPGHKGLDDKVIMQALKYLVSVHSQTGCDVVFGLISTYETTHVIWIKKVKVGYNFDVTVDETKLKNAWNRFGSSTSGVYQG